MSNITSISTVSSAAAAQPVKAPVVTTQQAAQQVATKAASLHVDKTALSQHSLTIANALKTSDVRTDKVASLQQSIADGTYSVSSSAVAGSLLQSLLG